MCRVIIFLDSVGCRASRGQYYGRAELHVGSYTSLFSFCSNFFFFFFLEQSLGVKSHLGQWAVQYVGSFYFFFIVN
jgi:hypothetical protein